MNIQMQICGLCIMLLLLYFCLGQKSLWMRNEKIFIFTLLVSMICVCLDIVSVVAIVHREALSVRTLDIICKTYLVSLVSVGFSGLEYTSLNLGKQKVQYVRTGFLVLIGITAVISIYVLPIEYCIEEKYVYTYGQSVKATYIYAVSCILLTLYKLVRNGRVMHRKRAKAIWLWMTIWVVAMLVQGLFNQFLLVGFATSIGMLILFFELENPEANMDRTTGLFNSHALFEYTKQKYSKGESFYGFCICIEQEQLYERIQKEIIDYLDSIPRAKIFKRADDEFMLLFEEKEVLYKILAEVRERFRHEWGRDGVNITYRIAPVYLVLSDSLIARSAEELLRIFSLCRVENENDENRSVIYIDAGMAERMREKDIMAKTIQKAIADDRVEVFYQPIYSVKEQRFVSAEALVRIRNTDGSILPPGKFIPVAEENGSIRRLGEIVFEKTCRFIKNYNLDQYGIRYIEVNLSVEQCECLDLADRYIQIMKKYQMNPACINLEITETGSIKTRNNMLKNMEQLIEFGVQFSLDDFGSGESNLNYIVDMPVEIIKFDRDMTQAYFENEKAKFVMQAAKNMIHDMGLRIVAEGVETEEQFSDVAGFGIDYIQGYYFSKPLPKNEFIKFIKSRQGTII